LEVGANESASIRIVLLDGDDSWGERGNEGVWTGLDSTDVSQALSGAGLEADEVGEVVMVGGCSRIPSLR
jgi:hypothetical protein